ncbi:class I SAM-dependent methyltransferase [Ruegeria sp.]|uniref:class I SAM-dependent methyltransferase n=1 Tax=Ruegeria sp. TaxID=1879320 RepID=UPI003AFF61CA
MTAGEQRAGGAAPGRANTGRWPYDERAYAQGHDRHYNLSQISQPHFRFECGTVERIIRDRAVSGWCDLACGTAPHLRAVRTHRPILRVGVDRAGAMLDVARQRAGPARVRLIEQDVRDLPPQPAHDLVTSFWYGYIHQDSLEEVFRFLFAAVNQVAPGGTLLLGLCDPLDLFDRQARHTPVLMGGDLDIDALIWSYTEPWSGARFANCIAPHADLIRDRLSAAFTDCTTLHYPPPGHRRANWNRKALLFTGRRVSGCAVSGRKDAIAGEA